MNQQVQVDLSKSTGVTCKECNSHFFDQTILIRKFSKVLTASPEDTMTLVPVFICRECGTLLKEFFPAGLSDVERDLGLVKKEESSNKFKLY